KYSSSKNLLKEPSIEAARKLAGIPLGELDEASAGIPSVVKPYGVPWDAEDSVSNHFVVTGGSLSAQANIFSGKVPLSRFGEGSRRLFSVGLGMGAAKEGALVLIDEIETGLEPHLVNLIHKLRIGHRGSAVRDDHILPLRGAGSRTCMPSQRRWQRRCSRLQTEENEIITAGLCEESRERSHPRVVLCEGQTSGANPN
ncbi:MAG: AAA family ATPase, partial [Collinsella sp.]